MLPFFPRDILDEILDLIESVSEGLPTHSMIPKLHVNILCIIISQMFCKRQIFRGRHTSLISIVVKINTENVGGGRVVRRCWVNFQCQGVLLT